MFYYGPKIKNGSPFFLPWSAASPAVEALASEDANPVAFAIWGIKKSLLIGTQNLKCLTEGKPVTAYVAG